MLNRYACDATEILNKAGNISLSENNSNIPEIL